jgi:hydroxymethylpyrimidine pyrophosphatase-like HAD family hydrolase
LAAALKDLDLSPEVVVGIGNAENDLALTRECGLRVAVVNALPRLKRRADWVVAKRGPDGVIELIRRLLAGRAPTRRRRRSNG